MSRSTPRLRRAAALAATGALVTGAAAFTASAPAAAAPGERSLATVLTSDGNHFDKNRRDFDIATEAVLAVLENDPSSPVGLLTDGSARLTAFVPTDRAFRALVEDLTGIHYARERRVFNQLVAAVGVDTVETVLLYHVVPGPKINRRALLQSDGEDLTTAQGGTFRVDVLPDAGKVKLRDQDPDDIDPRVALDLTNINRGNKQLAHGITEVLRPADL